MRRGEASRSVEGTFNLGVRNYTGQGATKNLAEAARLFHIAADQGFADAQFNVGAYLHAEGVSQDFGEGARYHRLAADQGFAPSQLALGTMLIDDEHAPAEVRALEPAVLELS
ncbi:hypothetical protein T492DRAFT_584296 [Pavlovales sp. CCMP2436]|nr:hypothetical protein T492DRAFT_584296 [Pavlovales sp. CCMP2436]